MIERGVSKSGSPTPRLMTSVIVARMSKNLRIPDGGTLRTRSDRARSASGGRLTSVAILASLVDRRGPLGGRRRARIVGRGEARRLHAPPRGPGRDALVGTRRAEKPRLGPGVADELQPHGQAVRE